MISYVGGKYRQSKWISSFIPNNIDTYIEVFGGAMWTYIKSDINCKKAIYNDFNPFMANLFSCCSKFNKFINYLDKVEPQDEKLFNEYKSYINNLYNNNTQIKMPDFDIGMKYVYLITQCFSGIINDKVKMVDLKGKYKSKFLSFRGRFDDIRIKRKLLKLDVYNLSYEELIPMFDSDENNYIYVDPPYWKTENLYGFHQFGHDDHFKLWHILKNSKCKWSLSYYDFPELRDAFPSNVYRWESKDFKKASMATKGKFQSVGTEILIMNY